MEEERLVIASCRSLPSGAARSQEVVCVCGWVGWGISPGDSPVHELSLPLITFQPSLFSAPVK